MQWRKTKTKKKQQKKKRVTFIQELQWQSWERQIIISQTTRGGHGIPLQYSCLEIPWTEEPGGLQFIGSHTVRHDWSDLACTHKPISKQDILLKASIQMSPGNLIMKGFKCLWENSYGIMPGKMSLPDWRNLNHDRAARGPGTEGFSFLACHAGGGVEWRGWMLSQSVHNGRWFVW